MQPLPAPKGRLWLDLQWTNPKVAYDFRAPLPGKYYWTIICRHNIARTIERLAWRLKGCSIVLKQSKLTITSLTFEGGIGDKHHFSPNLLQGSKEGFYKRMDIIREWILKEKMIRLYKGCHPRGGWKKRSRPIATEIINGRTMQYCWGNRKRNTQMLL